ncbi:cell division protein SepF [Aphanothece hegewaldii CCALA 016]|uniref:Cell division protein SepF n=1 Tax=Aphanothece hegewaldii CCALA 016 TaxID=2107694 RepID=A0A2T1LZW4_9CHRO|nr:cell division protein SepF [Aphanothece hegewaldii]PSF37956.1 cell division protein SepF [Aphanothece hegewaldii CCALA 016]
MTNLFEKIKNFVSSSESDNDDYETDYPDHKWQQSSNFEEEEEEEPAKPEPTPYRRSRETMNFPPDTSLGINRTSNVIGMPGITNNNAEVVVIEPHSFDEMPQVIQTLKERKSVVLNLNVMDPEEAQRAVDFVAGGTFAIDGHQERIGESIFLFTPSCVKVSTLGGALHDVTETSKVNFRSTSTSSWGADVNRIAQ